MNITTTPTRDTRLTPPTAPTTATVDAFLDAVRSGNGIPQELYSTDACLDATVPNWRFSKRGAQEIAAEYGRWFADAGAFEELVRVPVAGGEVVTYLLTWEEHGVPHAAHHCHSLTLDDDGRIASDVVFCGGRWPASLLAEMVAPQ